MLLIMGDAGFVSSTVVRKGGVSAFLLSVCVCVG